MMYFHRGQFQATRMLALNLEKGRDTQSHTIMLYFYHTDGSGHKEHLVLLIGNRMIERRCFENLIFLSLIQFI